jgi:hypothetical protein
MLDSKKSARGGFAVTHKRFTRRRWLERAEQRKYNDQTERHSQEPQNDWHVLLLSSLCEEVSRTRHVKFLTVSISRLRRVAPSDASALINKVAMRSG